MNTLPRFRLPDESSSQNLAKVSASGAWSEFDDLDKVKTRILVRKTAKTANVEDVVHELRAAAAGRSSPVRELTSDDLLDEVPDADDVQEVDVGELVFDRVALGRSVWNVRQATRPPRASIVGPKPVPTRFLVTAAVAMFLGAMLAVGLALVIWRLSGVSL